MSRRHSLALIAGKAGLGASLALGLALSPHSTAHVYAAPDSAIEEDSPQWDCRTMGNHVCGPTNSQGVPVGTYSSTAYRLGTGPLADFGDDAGYDAGYEN